jgi:hypothetical protein
VVSKAVGKQKPGQQTQQPAQKPGQPGQQGGQQKVTASSKERPPGFGRGFFDTWSKCGSTMSSSPQTPTFKTRAAPERSRKRLFSLIVSDDHINVRLVIAAAFLQIPHNSCGKPAGFFFVLQDQGVREIGLIGFAAQIQHSWHTGSYVMETAEHREPCESRGSRTVLGARGGEIPPRDSSSASFQTNAKDVRSSSHCDQIAALGQSTRRARTGSLRAGHCTCRSGRLDFIGDHLEPRERTRAERGHDRDVGGVASARH